MSLDERRLEGSRWKISGKGKIVLEVELFDSDDDYGTLIFLNKFTFSSPSESELTAPGRGRLSSQRCGGKTRLAVCCSLWLGWPRNGESTQHSSNPHRIAVYPADTRPGKTIIQQLIHYMHQRWPHSTLS